MSETLIVTPKRTVRVTEPYVVHAIFLLKISIGIISRRLQKSGSSESNRLFSESVRWIAWSGWSLHVRKISFCLVYPIPLSCSIVTREKSDFDGKWAVLLGKTVSFGIVPGVKLFGSGWYELQRHRSRSFSL